MIAVSAPRRFLLLLLVAWIVAPVIGEKCLSSIDLALLLDDSSSIASGQWKDVLDFAKSFVDLYDISEKGTRIAVMTYSTNAVIRIPFKYDEIAKLKNEIGSIRQMGGFTYMDRALEKANQELFTERAGMRTSKNVKKVAIIMTDGFQTVSQDSITPLEDAAYPLKQKGVEIYALGVGGDVGLGDLSKIVSKPLNMYSARRFEDMKEVAKDLAKAQCPSKPKEAVQISVN